MNSKDLKNFALTETQACVLRNSLWQASQELSEKNEAVANLLETIGNLVSDMQGTDTYPSDVEYRIERAAFLVK